MTCVVPGCSGEATGVQRLCVEHEAEWLVSGEQRRWAHWQSQREVHKAYVALSDFIDRIVAERANTRG